MLDFKSDRTQIGNTHEGYVRFIGSKAVGPENFKYWVEITMIEEAKMQGIEGCYNNSIAYNIIPRGIKGEIYGGGYLHVYSYDADNTFSQLLLGKEDENGKPILPLKSLYMTTEEVDEWYNWKKTDRMSSSDRKIFEREYHDYKKFYTRFEQKTVKKKDIDEIYKLFAEREHEDSEKSEEEEPDVSKFREKYKTREGLEALMLELRRFAKCEEFKLEPVRITENKEVIPYYIFIYNVDPAVKPLQIKEKFSRYSSDKQKHTKTYPCLYSSNTEVIEDTYPHVFKERKSGTDLVLYHVIFADTVGSDDAQLAVMMSMKFDITFQFGGRDITKQYVAKLRPVNGNTRSTHLPVSRPRKTQTYTVRSLVKKPEPIITPAPIIELTDEKKTPDEETETPKVKKSCWNKPVPKSMIAVTATNVETVKVNIKKPSVQRRGYTSHYPNGDIMKDDGNASVFF